MRVENPRLRAAVSELQHMITKQYPEASFDVVQGDDPEGTYIWTAVDRDDPDSVLDVVIDRMLELQVEEQVPVHVIPIRTLEHQARMPRPSHPRRLRIGSDQTVIGRGQ